MKTVLEIIKGLGANGKDKEGFVTMGADTTFLSEYLYAHLAARTVVFDCEVDNEKRYSLKKGGGMLYIEYLGAERIGNAVNDNYKVTYRTAQGTYYVVNAATMDSKTTEYVRNEAASQYEDACAAEKLAVIETTPTQPSVIGTPAVQTANKAPQTILGLIQTLATEQAASTNQLIELPKGASFVQRYVRATMLASGGWNVIQRDGKEMTALDPAGAKLTVQDAGESLQDGVLYDCETVIYKDHVNYYRLYFIIPSESAEWLRARTKAMEAGMLSRPLAQKVARLDFDALPITAIPPQTSFGFTEWVKTQSDYIIEGVSRNRVWGDCISARPFDYPAAYYGRTAKGKHKFHIPTAEGDERFPEYTDAQLARVLKAIAVV